MSDANDFLSRYTASAVGDSLAADIIRYVHDQRGLWQMARPEFWFQLVKNSPAERLAAIKRVYCNFEESTSPAAAENTDVEEDRLRRTAHFLRSWFHVYVLPRWRRLIPTVHASGPDSDYYQLMALMRERRGFEPYAAAPARGMAVRMVTRALLTEQVHAEQRAQQHAVDQLDLSVSFELCTPAERREGRLLRGLELRKRLREHRNGVRDAGGADNNVAAADETTFDDYKVAVLRCANAVEAQQLEASSQAASESFVITLWRRDPGKQNPQTAVELPGTPTNRTTIAASEITALTSDQRRSEINRLVAIGDCKQLFEFIDRLPAAHRLKAEATLRRQLQRKSPSGQPRFTIAQQRIANRLPITPATGMLRNTRALRRLSISGPRSDRRARPVGRPSTTTAPVLSAGRVRPSVVGGRASVRYSSFARELFAGDERRLPSQTIAEPPLMSADAAAPEVEVRPLPSSSFSSSSTTIIDNGHHQSAGAATSTPASASGAGVSSVGVRSRSMRSVSVEPRLSPIEETESSQTTN